jgi:hypothetical protein
MRMLGDFVGEVTTLASITPQEIPGRETQVVRPIHLQFGGKSV